MKVQRSVRHPFSSGPESHYYYDHYSLRFLEYRIPEDLILIIEAPHLPTLLLQSSPDLRP